MSIGAVGGGNSMISSLLMKAMDQDKSGTASLEEFTSLGQSLETGSFDQSDEALSKAFSALDADQDGALTKDEIAQGLAKFSQASAQALLGAQEAGGPPPPPPEAKDGGGGFFAEADSDGSGSVSLAEFTSAGPKSVASDEVESLFAEIDEDGDGEISKAEDEAFRTAQGEDGRGGPQGPGGPPPPPPAGGASASASDDTQDDATSQLLASLSELLNASGAYGSASAGMFDEAISSLFATSA